MYLKILFFMSFFEVGFIGQRNRLHRRLQLASLGNEAYCILCLSKSSDSCYLYMAAIFSTISFIFILMVSGLAISIPSPKERMREKNS